MKYKNVIETNLEILINRLDGLKSALQNNKPLTTDEFVRQLEISINSANQILEKVNLEGYDSAAYQSR